MIKAALAFCSFLAFALTAQSQVVLSSFSYSENFDGIGSGAAAALPTGWVMSGPAGATSPTYTAAGNFSATNLQASTGSPTTGGRYNWGNGTTTTDRAIGFMTSGGYASPNSIMFAITNNLGITITDLNVSFDYERYRINTSAASISFFISTDGINWTSVSAGDSGAYSTGANSYGFALDTINRNFMISGLSIAQSSNLYFRWDFSTVGANSQGLGLDNFSVSVIPEPATYMLFGIGLLACAQRFRRAKNNK